MMKLIPHTQDAEYYNVILQLTGDQLPFREITQNLDLKCLVTSVAKKQENPSQQANTLFLQHQQHLLTSKNSLWVRPDAGQMCFTSKEQCHLEQIVKQLHKNRLAVEGLQGQQG